MLVLEVSKEYENVRIDRVARQLMKGFSLSYVFSSFRKGKIKVNSKKVDQSYRLQLGDNVVFYDLVGTVEKKNAEVVVSKEACIELSKQIVFENDDFLLFNKNGNQVIHTGSEHEVGLVEILKQYYNNPDLTAINRLDKPTWGLVLIGKNKSSIRMLSQYQKNSEITKKYLAICKGSIKKNEFFIDKALLTCDENVIVSKEGKVSKTGVKCLLSRSDINLVELELFTGRKHQIRVHLASEKLPIIGDYKYGIKFGKKMYLGSYYIEIKPLNFKFEIESIKETFVNIIMGE
ncbi:MAG: RluA family pseudouridine synthase [Fusobacteria bacterium]|nr:RluA family pseudouridine synthase [Fusobacteriota bacterium]